MQSITQSIPITLSVLALVVSVFTFWYNSLRRGRVQMTRPTMIGVGFGGAGKKNQVFVRCMLFTTASRGSVIENMYARVRRGETAQNFSIWVHGQVNNMERGAGLTVTQNGITKNFHFLLRPDEPDFVLVPGTYIVEIICRVLGSKTETVLSFSTLTITPNLLAHEQSGIQFDWAPDSDCYVGHAANRLPMQLTPN